MPLLNIVQDWMNYLGHFHPVVVHLPIGILFVAFILEIVAWKQKQPGLLKHAIEICLIAGFFGAVISCLFGWFLSKEGGYEEKTLQLHQWMGIGVALLSGISWLVKKRYGLLNKATKPYRILLGSIFILLILTGHLGGNMTHGEDYLTAGMPQPFAGWLGIEEKKDSSVAPKPITDVNEAVLYTDIIQPIFSAKCYDCHSSKKVKGSLRMDEEKLLFKGGKHGAVIQPGNADASELMKRLLLPMEDDKRMPPKDQPQLTKEEIELIGWWIRTGADTKKKVKELAADEKIKPVLASFGSGGADTASQEVLSKVFELNPSEPGKDAVEKLRALGMIVSPVAKEKHLLEVSAINVPAFDNAKAALLAELAENIVWLRLDNTAVTDEAMGQVGKLKNLVRLNISGTVVSSAGMASLQALKNLEYINIVNTEVDDRGLLVLASLPALKNVYCWNTAVSAVGVENLKKKNPVIRVDAGDK
ncbi:hypothetical protein LZZ85_21805 [Terrimonas sp. NA20]|uniref:Cytochrome c domain-containing protein n=1 Tax=Terrimonas ginsenosidimutans TaxID=2908004 RepID=A0ABS9KXD5_9BACT|nr:c-type cytochrome domain-containing protein [Terrimonas ginsenosidimutans]MCG2616948.1 hypothetical protein [Terrimonas ginsenosidimutans]